MSRKIVVDVDELPLEVEIRNKEGWKKLYWLTASSKKFGASLIRPFNLKRKKEVFST